MAERCKLCDKDLIKYGMNCVLSTTFKGLVCFECISTNETTSKLIIPDVTELEKDAIINGIGNSEFFDNFENNIVWANKIIDNCAKTSPTEIQDVLSSLVEKGLINLEGVNKKTTAQLTAEGLWYYITHKKDQVVKVQEVIEHHVEKCKICNEVVTHPNFNGVHSHTLKGEVCYPCIEKSVDDPDSVDFKLVIPNITGLEHDLIINGIGKSDFFAFSCYENVPNGCVPINVLTETCKKITPTQISGVVSSLTKKVLIVRQNVGRYSYIQLTAEGYWYYLTHRGE